jgi:hypothetical protein
MSNDWKYYSCNGGASKSIWKVQKLLISLHLISKSLARMAADNLLSDYYINVGKRVTKTTNKPHGKPNPFKSGQSINTIMGVIFHPILRVPAYIFEEDDSYVECRRCIIVEC